MAFKVLFIAALVALTQAAHPTEYIISAPSVDHGSVGNTQEHTIKGHYGQNAHSEYSSTANTAHSTSHVSRTDISNDAVGYGGHYGGGHVAAPAYAHAGYAAPAVAPVATVAHVAAPAYAHSYAAPAYAHSYAAPAIKVAAPAVAYAPTHSYAAHVAAPAYAHGYAAPAVSYAHGGAAYGHGGVYGHGLSYGGYGGYGGYGHGFGYKAAYAAPVTAAHYAAPVAAAHYAAPVATAHYAAPVAAAHYATSHYAAPLAVTTAVAAPVVHTSFLGHGAHYAY